LLLEGVLAEVETFTFRVDNGGNLALIGGEAAKEGGRICLISGAILADQGCVDNG
jgi:hypothetical protein